MNAGRLQSAVAMSIAVRETFSNREILLVEVYHQLNWKSLNDTYLNQVNYMCTCTSYLQHALICPLLSWYITGYVSELYRSKASSHSSTCNVKQQTDVACTCCCGLLVFTLSLSLSLLSVSSPSSTEYPTVGLLVQGGEYCACPFSRNLTSLHEIWMDSWLMNQKSII